MNKKLKLFTAFFVAVMAVAAAGAVVLIQSDDNSAGTPEWDGLSDVAAGTTYYVSTGTVNLSADRTIAGTLIIDESGTLVVNSGINLTVTGSLTLNGGELRNSGNITGSGTVGYFGTKLLNSNGDSGSSAADITVTTRTGGVVVYNLSNTAALEGTVYANGNYVMIKAVEGSTTLCEVVWDKNQDGIAQTGETVSYNSLSSFIMGAAKIYGGSDTRDVASSHIEIYAGTISTIVVGGINGHNVSDAELEVIGGTIANIYGSESFSSADEVLIVISKTTPVDTTVGKISLTNVTDEADTLLSATLNVSGGTITDVTGGNGDIATLNYNISGGMITNIIAGDGNTIGTLNYNITGGAITNMTAAFATDDVDGKITTLLNITNLSGTPTFGKIIMGAGIEVTLNVIIDMNTGEVLLQKTVSPTATETYSLSNTAFTITDGTLSVPSTTQATITSDISFIVSLDADLYVSGVLTFDNGRLSYASMADITTDGNGKIVFNHGSELYDVTATKCIVSDGTTSSVYKTTTGASVELTSTSSQATDYTLLIKGNVSVEIDPAVANSSKVIVDNGAVLTLNVDMAVSNADGIIVNRSTGESGSSDGEIVVPVNKTLILSDTTAYNMSQIAKITLIAGTTASDSGKVTRNSVDLLATDYGMEITESTATSAGLTIQYDSVGNKDLTVNANTLLTFATATDTTTSANLTIGVGDSLTVKDSAFAVVNVKTVIAGTLAVNAGATFTVNDIGNALELTNVATIDGTLTVVDTDLAVTGTGSVVFSDDAIFQYDGHDIIKNTTTYGTFYVSDSGTITLSNVVNGNLLVGQFNMAVAGDLYINDTNVSQFALSHTVTVSGDVYVVAGLTINVNGTMTIGSSDSGSSMYFVGTSSSTLNVTGTQTVYGSVLTGVSESSTWGDMTVNVSGYQDVEGDIGADNLTVNVIAGNQVVRGNIGSATSTTVVVSSSAGQQIDGNINSGGDVSVTVGGTQSINGIGINAALFGTNSVWAFHELTITVTGIQTITGDIHVGGEATIKIANNGVVTVSGDVNILGTGTSAISLANAGVLRVLGTADGGDIFAKDTIISMSDTSILYIYTNSGLLGHEVSVKIEELVIGGNAKAYIGVNSTTETCDYVVFECDELEMFSSSSVLYFHGSLDAEILNFTAAGMIYLYSDVVINGIIGTANFTLMADSEFDIENWAAASGALAITGGVADEIDVVFYGGANHTIASGQSIDLTSIETVTFGKDTGQTTNDILTISGHVNVNGAEVHVAGGTTLILEVDILDGSGVVDPNDIILDDDSSILVAVTYWKFVLHYIDSSGSWVTEGQYISKATGLGGNYGEFNWYASHPGWNTTIALAGYTIVNWTNSSGSTVDLNFMRPTNPGTSLSDPATYNVVDIYANYKVDVDYVYSSGTVYSKVLLGDTIKLPTATPASGYAFTGWSDGSSIVGTAGEVYTVAAPVTLTAQFEKILTYTIEFTGDGTASAIADITDLYEGQTVTLPSATYAGYTFVGWSVDGTEVSAVLPGQYTVSASDADTYVITLVAVFTEDTVLYTVTFNYNGGTGVNGSIEVPENSSIVLPTTSKDGHTLDGWYDGTTIVGTAGQYYTVTADVTLTAEFTEIKTFTVKLMVDGGLYRTQDELVDGETVTLPTATLEGYTFVGWAVGWFEERSDIIWGQYVVWEADAVDSTITLYAVFIEDPTYYTVEFDYNGGTEAADSFTVVGGTAILLPTTSKDGHTLDGWYDGTTIVGTAGQYYTVTADVTLTAGFTEIQTFNVHLIVSGSTYDTLSVLVDGDVITLPTAILDGYTFVGWAVGDDDGAAVVSGQYIVNASDADTGVIDLYAVFTEDAVMYTVTFDYSGGTGVNGSIKVSDGVSIVLPTASKVGHTFDGWYDDDDFVGTTGQYYTVTADVTLTASFTEVDIYTVSFSVDGIVLGSCGVVAGNMITLPSAAGATGYEFAGWFVETADGAFAGVSGSVYTPTGDVTLVAVFTATASHTVTYAATENGAVVGNTSALTGGYVFIYTSPAAGYAVDSITVSGASETYTVSTLISGSLYMVIVGSEDLTVAVTFATSSNTFVITPVFTGAGSVAISVNGVGTMPEGAELTMTYTYLDEFMGGWIFTTVTKTYSVTSNPWTVVDSDLDETTSAMVGTLSYTVSGVTYHIPSGTVVYIGS